MNTTNDILEAAIELAKQGRLVFPVHGVTEGLCTCRNAECSSKGKHPKTTHGSKDATTDLDLIRDWFHQGSELNLGIAAGTQSGLLVVDIDPRHGGHESLARLISEHGEPPETVCAETGGGGWHFYFKHPGGFVPNSAGAIAPGIDVRGDGGYVVAPPSLHESGRRYQWVKGRGPGFTMALAPAWVLGQAKSRARGAVRAPRPASEWAELLRGQIAQGQRNVALARLSGLLFRRLPAAVAYELLLAVNEARCAPPLTSEEIDSIADSIARREHARTQGGLR